MNSSNIVSVTKHKYKWKSQEIFSIVVFAVIPIALWFFTNPTLTASLGTICGAIAIFLVYIGFARKKASELTANVFDDGSVQILGKVTGQDYEDNNRVVLKDVTTIKWEKYAHHPTLRLSTGSGPSLFLPRRVAEEEPLNSFIRANLSKKVYVVEEARATLNEILEDGSDNNTTDSLEHTSAPVTAAVSLSEIKDAEKVLGINQDESSEATTDTPEVKDSQSSMSPASDLSNLNGLFGENSTVKFDAVTQTPLHDGSDDSDEIKIVLESPVAESKPQPRKRSRPQKKD